MEQLNVEKPKAAVAAKKPTKPDYKYMRDKDREMVKGIFRFHECPGGVMSFVYKFYKEDPVERFDLVDGQVHTIPLGVAKHLNKNCWYPEYDYIKSEGKTVGGFSPDGKVMRVSRKVKRCSFQSLEFIDAEDIGSSEPMIYTVEKAIV
jgi:hypothetical protein